ncbi:MAG TPA: hypothetical protein VKC89_00920 [Patescibacteria group bacterium]|nr:hypothetical protein [Patescibacteria group bacterium]
MSLVESQPHTLVTEDGKPIVRVQGDDHRCDIFAGLFGPSRGRDIFLDRVIAHAEFVGTIASHDPKERKINLPQKGSGGDHLVQIFRSVKGLKKSEEKRQRVVSMLEFIKA